MDLLQNKKAVRFIKFTDITPIDSFGYPYHMKINLFADIILNIKGYHDEVDDILDQLRAFCIEHFDKNNFSFQIGQTIYSHKILFKCKEDILFFKLTFG